ncbi:hypothetical protein HDU93_000387 [Gonapodya sp. JEL0774]|nr:hypothetical protein HDU93_000387 [Gonapodya sp. JEL0774]
MLGIDPTTVSNTRFPLAVATAYPGAHAVYSTLRRRIDTIETNAAHIASSLEVGDEEGTDKGESSGEGGDSQAQTSRLNVAELVRREFSPMVYEVYIRWKPALEGMEDAARELQSASDRLAEAESMFASVAEKSEAAPLDSPVAQSLESTFPEPMKIIRTIHPKQYRKYLRYRLKLHEMETAAEVLVGLGEQLDTKREEFLATAGAVEDLGKMRLDRDQTLRLGMRLGDRRRRVPAQMLMLRGVPVLAHQWQVAQDKDDLKRLSGAAHPPLNLRLLLTTT